MSQILRRINRSRSFFCLLFALLTLAAPRLLFAQLDEGAITGTVTDPKGAAVAYANVRLVDTGTNFTLESKTDQSGVFTFQPIRIGNYSVTVSAPGFSTTTKSGLVLHVNGRLEANIQLRVGKVTETLHVDADALPLLQTDDATTGQVMSTQQINDIPLNQRNYVFLAQLSTGVNSSNGSRGEGNGDFNANGQRSTENNFILDGVDNNSNSIDFLNGASYNVKPPPDALQEFNIQTSDSSAQFGHSAGAVVNASIKQGTNSIHGDLWEYIRNNDFGEAPSPTWVSGLTVPKVFPYHQNQFGGTVGGPIWKNKAFFFFDYEGNRIVFNNPAITSIPTALMLSDPGNFSELLTPANTGASLPWLLMEPYTGGGTETQNSPYEAHGMWTGTKYLGSSCGNAANVMCSSQIDPNALKLFKAAYSAPPGQRINSVPASQTYNNWAWTSGGTDTTNQWDARIDYNLSDKDQVFGRVSWQKENRYVLAPLGPVFDGGGTDNDGTFINNAKNVVLSWNHVFSPTLINQVRFGYNWGSYSWYQQSYNNSTLDSTYGLGGLAAYSASEGNGGLPQIYVNEFPELGPPLFQPSPEGQNVYQIIDDATRIWHNHSFKFGVDIQNVRYSVYQPEFGKAAYNYWGGNTEQPGSTFNSGYGLADFFAGGNATSGQGASGPGGTQGSGQDWTGVSEPTPTNNGRWYRAAYVQDDWKFNRRLTLNLGLRWDYFSAPVERKDAQAEFQITGPINTGGAGTGNFIFPSSQSGIQSKFATYSPYFASDLAADNINVTFSSNRSLLNPQKGNFAPRVGASYQVTDKFVARLGGGIYFDGVENLGNYVNLGANFPFDIEMGFDTPGCSAPSGGGANTALGYTACPGNGILLETGPAASVAPYLPGLTGWDRNIHTPYTINQNLTLQYALSSTTTATVGYVGSEARHLAVVVWPNGMTQLLPSGEYGGATSPYPAFYGNIHYISYGAMANYNSLQAKLERRFSNGLSFLSSYTWSHNLDDSREPLPSNNDGGDRMYNVFGLRIDYGNSPFDVRDSSSPAPMSCPSARDASTSTRTACWMPLSAAGTRPCSSAPRTAIRSRSPPTPPPSTVPVPIRPARATSLRAVAHPTPATPTSPAR
jgi:hypothetical protein